MTFQYVVYGLRLRSNRSLPGLPPFSDALPDAPLHAPSVTNTDNQIATSRWPDVVIEFDQHSRTLDQCSMDWVGGLRLGLPDGPALKEYTARHSDGTYLRQIYTDGCEWCEFIINPAVDSIHIKWSREAPFEDIVALLLGPVLGRVLRLRGETCLHANAINVSSRAITLAGAKGTGKSTTAAALLQAGCSSITDDIAVLREEGRQAGCEAGTIFCVQPGHPSLRLCPNAVHELFDHEAPLRAVWTNGAGRPDKQYLNLSQQPGAFTTHPIPLAAIYLLEDRASHIVRPSVESMNAQEALLSLVKYTFANVTLDAKQRANEFAFLARLVRQVPVRRVRRPDSLKLLPQIARLILDDAYGLTTSPAVCPPAVCPPAVCPPLVCLP